MNRKLLVVFICASVAAAALAYMVYRALSARGSATPIARTSDVIVATRDLVVGTLISAADLTVAKWPGTTPKGSLVKRDLALNRGVISPIYEGEPITPNRLAAAGSGGGLAAIIPAGMRACAVKVDDVVGVAGFVTPGMRVDVLMSGIPPGEGVSGPMVKTLMQNIQVLSAGTNLQKDSEGKAQQVQVVNLLVTPEQAETLSLASSQTRIQLVLRNPVDMQVANPPGTAMAQLFGVPARPAIAQKTEPVPEAKVEARTQAARVSPAAAPAPAPVPAAFRVVEVLNGVTRSEAHFDRREDHRQ